MGVDASLTSVPQFDQLELVLVANVAESSVTTAGNTTVTFFNHNLGYIPIAITYFGAAGAEGIPMPRFSYNASGDLDQVIICNAINSQNITFTHSERTGSGGPFSFKFYLLRYKGSLSN